MYIEFGRISIPAIVEEINVGVVGSETDICHLKHLWVEGDSDRLRFVVVGVDTHVAA